MKRSLPVAGVALAALALLAACAAGPTTPSDSGTPEPAPSAGGAYDGISPYYPVGLGNTWVYRMNYGEPVGEVTETEVMTAVTPEGDDVRVTIERSFHYENGSQPDFTDSVEYIFHPDGSVSVPYQSMSTAGAETVIHDGQMEWPSTAEFEAGTEKTGVINLTTTIEGSSFDQSVQFSIRGDGIEPVTVPAGTFEARKLLQSMLVSIPSAGVDALPINATVWLAEGVGQVRSEVPDLLGSGTPVVVELLSFTPGS